MSTLLERPPSRAGAPSPWVVELRATLVLALPMIATQLGQIAIAVTDIAMTGRLGAEALAASSAAASIYFLALIAGLGLVSVTGSLVAQARGRRDPRGVRRSVRQGLWVALSFSLPAMLLLSQSEAILLTVGHAAPVAALAEVYLGVMLWSLPWSLIFLVLRNFLGALSRPRAALVVTLSGVVSNAVLNYALMFGHFGLPALGLKGAAVSSLVNTAGMCLALLAFVLLEPKLRRYRILLRFWRPDWPRYLLFLRLGLPAAGILTAELGLFSMATTMMGWIGDDALAAHAIALNLASITFMVPSGLAQAGQVRIGLAFGGGDGPGQARAGWSALVLGSLFMGLAALVFLLLPELLVAAYLGFDEASLAAAELAVTLLAIAALFQLFDGAQVILAALLRGVNDTKFPMLLGLFGYWGVGLPVAYAVGFPLGLGASGVWLGLAAGLVVVAFLLLLRFRRYLARLLAP